MEPRFKSDELPGEQRTKRSPLKVYVVKYRCMHGEKGGHVMHAMHAIHLADVIVRERLLPGSMRTPKLDIIPEVFNKPGCNDEPEVRRKPEVLREPKCLEVPSLQIVP